MADATQNAATHRDTNFFAVTASDLFKALSDLMDAHRRVTHCEGDHIPAHLLTNADALLLKVDHELRSALSAASESRTNELKALNNGASALLLLADNAARPNPDGAKWMRADATILRRLAGGDL